MTLIASLLGSDFSAALLFFAGQMQFGIYDIVKSLTIPGWVVIFVLLVQSVYLIAVGIERLLTYNKAKQQSRQYAPKVAQALKNSNIDEAISISDKHKDSHLAMVVSTAPFVGLFGTVVGIIAAFVSLAQAETAGIAAVGGAIAEALVATAFGIGVAVPAVWLFNYFTNKVTSFGVEMENSASELVDYFIRQRTKRLHG